jgi:hypothetical protein
MPVEAAVDDAEFSLHKPKEKEDSFCYFCVTNLNYSGH